MNRRVWGKALFVLLWALLVGEAQAEDWPPQVQAQVQKAWDAHQQGIWSAAAIQYENAWRGLGGASCKASSKAAVERCAWVLERLIEVSKKDGRTAEALTWCDRALKLVADWENPLQELLILREKAGLLRILKRAEAAKILAQGALSQSIIFLKDPEEQAKVYMLLGVIAVEAGFDEQALANFQEAIPLLEQVENQEQLANVQMMMAGVKLKLGAYASAGREVAAAKELLEEVPSSQSQLHGELLELLVQIRQDPDLGKFGRGLRELAEKFSGTPAASQAPFLEEFGRYMELLDLTEDREGIRQESRRFLEAAVPTTAGDALSFQELRGASTALEEGRLNEVASYFNGLAEDSLRRGSVVQAARWLDAVALTFWIRQQPSEAIEIYRRLTELLDEKLMSFGSDELRLSYLEAQEKYFRKYVDLLVLESRIEEAFDIAERARSRTLLRLLGAAYESPRSPSATAPLSGERDKLLQEIRNLEERRTLEGASVSLDDELGARRRNFEDFLLRRQIRNLRKEGEPRQASGEDPHSGQRLASLEAAQAHLPPATTLVSFFATPSGVYAWIMDKESFAFVETGWNSQDLERVSRFRKALAAEAGREIPRGREVGRGAVSAAGQEDPKPPEWTRDREALGKELFEGLIRPLLPHLKNERLMLVPYGVLHALPFGALQNPENGRFLAQDYTLSFLPSASALEALQKPGASSGTPRGEGFNALIFGDSVPVNPWLGTLLGAREEARTASFVFKSRAWLGQEATETRFHAGAPQADLLYLAVHGVYQPRHPLFTHLALSADEDNDGQLEVWEILERVELPRAPLVVLSGCETALGPTLGGDEINGLVRAFLAAGSPEVLATLWAVDDGASAALMSKFLEHYQSGLSASEALRRAQLTLLKTPGSQAPYYWAGFGVTGIRSTAASEER